MENKLKYIEHLEVSIYSSKVSFVEKTRLAKSYRLTLIYFPDFHYFPLSINLIQFSMKNPPRN